MTPSPAQCWNRWLASLRLSVRQAGPDGLTVAQAERAVTGACGPDLPTVAVLADLLDALAR